MVEAFYPVLADGGVMINFSSVAAYTMPQTDEWTQAFEAWNEPDFYDRLLAMAGEAEDEEGEFFRAGLAYAMSKKFVIYFTQKNVARFAEKHCRILSISPGCYLTPMHQKLIDNQPETAENQLELIPAGRWGATSQRWKRQKRSWTSLAWRAISANRHRGSRTGAGIGRLGPDTLTAWTFSPTAVRTPESSSLKFNRHIKWAALRSERRPF